VTTPRHNPTKIECELGGNLIFGSALLNNSNTVVILSFVRHLFHRIPCLSLQDDMAASGNDVSESDDATDDRKLALAGESRDQEASPAVSGVLSEADDVAGRSSQRQQGSTADANCLTTATATDTEQQPTCSLQY